MAQIIIPDTRFEAPELFEPNVKPVDLVEINKDNQFGAVCTSAVLLEIGAFDLVTGNKLTVSNSPDRKVGPVGTYYDFNGNSGNIQVDLVGLSGEQLTVAFRSQYGSDQDFVSVGDGAGTNEYEMYSSTSDNHSIFSFLTSSNIYDVIRTYSTGWVWNIITIDSLNNQINWYEDRSNVQLGLTSFTGFADAKILTIGNNSAFDFAGDHAISDVFLFNGAFTSSQILEFVDNPYQIFDPA